MTDLLKFLLLTVALFVKYTGMGLILISPVAAALWLLVYLPQVFFVLLVTTFLFGLGFAFLEG